MNIPTSGRLRGSRAIWLSRRLWRQRLVFWGGAVAVGVISVGFARAAALAQGLFERVVAVSPWLALALTPLGFVAAAWLCRTAFPGSSSRSRR